MIGLGNRAGIYGDFRYSRWRRRGVGHRGRWQGRSNGHGRGVGGAASEAETRPRLLLRLSASSGPPAAAREGEKTQETRAQQQERPHATLVAMYTLRRGTDGRLHGPINKKIWGQFGRRKDMLQWACDQATRRGFGPDTDKQVQIVLDGERCLRKEFQVLFPRTIFTLDVRHAQERLWIVGRLFCAEASKELEQWVEPLNTLLLSGRVGALLERLRKTLAQIPLRGPNTKMKRETIQTQLGYFEERRDMMHYDDYRREDLVLATGVIEGACRYVVKERLDCAGMRWTLQGAERLLQLRCIELNGDWEGFITWA